MASWFCLLSMYRGQGVARFAWLLQDSRLVKQVEKRPGPGGGVPKGPRGQGPSLDSATSQPLPFPKEGQSEYDF